MTAVGLGPKSDDARPGIPGCWMAWYHTRLEEMPIRDQSVLCAENGKSPNKVLGIETLLVGWSGTIA